MKCGKCGREGGVRPSCMYCGAALVADQKCPGCGRTLSGGASKCVFCGHVFARAPQAGQDPRQLALARGEWFAQAEMLRKKQSFMDAARLYGEIVRADPAMHMAWLGFAKCLANAGDKANAIAALDRCLGLQPTHDEARKLREVLAAAAEQARVQPTVGARSSAQPAPAAQRRVVLDLGNHQEVLEEFDRLLSALPPERRSQEIAVDLHIGRAAALQALGWLHDADDAVGHALRAAPRNARALALRGSILDDLGRLGDALACFDQAVARDPVLHDAWVDRGVVLRHLEQPVQAIASYDRAIALDSSNALAWNNRGNACVDLARMADAVRSFERVVQLDSKQTHARTMLEELRVRGGGASPEPPGRKPLLDWPTLAEQFVKQSQEMAGPTCDFSVASVAAFDVYLDLVFGTAPNVALNERGPNETEQGLIVGAGAYVGEVLRRRVGGVWRDALNENPAPYSTGVFLHGESAAQALPFMRVFRRLKYGTERLLPWLDGLRKQAQPQATELRWEAVAWIGHGEAVVANDRPQDAIAFFERGTRICPSIARGWYKLAETQRALGRDCSAAAREFLGRADPTSEEASVRVVKGWVGPRGEP